MTSQLLAEDALLTLDPQDLPSPPAPAVVGRNPWSAGTSDVRPDAFDAWVRWLQRSSAE